MKKLNLWLFLSLFVAAFTLSACGSDGDGDDPAPTNLKTNVLYATFPDGKTIEIEIVGIGGNALNPMSSEENHFTFFDGPCDVHLECNFKTGNGTGDIELMDQRALDPTSQAVALEYSRVGGEFKATKCRYEKGILYFHIEGSGQGTKVNSQETVKCTFRADVKQTGTIYYPN
jgi:hypothetical protein